MSTTTTCEERIARLRQSLLMLNILRKFSRELEMPDLREDLAMMRAKVTKKLIEAERLDRFIH